MRRPHPLRRRAPSSPGAWRSARQALRLALTLTTLTLTTWAQPTWAHVGAPSARAVQTRQDGTWVLETNFGFILSEQPKRYICEESFLGGLTFPMVQLDAQRWVIATTTGIMRTLDAGCTYERVQPLTTSPRALAVEPQTGVLIHLTDQEDLGSPLWLSRDGGATFQAHPGLDVVKLDVRWTGAGFVGPERLLVLGYSIDELDRGAARAWLLDLQTQELTALDTMQGLSYPYLLTHRQGHAAGVATTPEGVSLWWDPVEQLGQTRAPITAWPASASLEPEREAQTLWVVLGDSQGAVQRVERSAEGALTWTTRWQEHLATCVHALGQDALMICTMYELAGADLWRLPAGASKAEPLVSFLELEGVQRGCGERSPVTQTCPVVWEELAKQLRLTPEAPMEPQPGGGSDMGEADAPGQPGSTRASGGCASAPWGAPAWPSFAWLGLGALVALRRVSSRRPWSGSRSSRRNTFG